MREASAGPAPRGAGQGAIVAAKDQPIGDATITCPHCGLAKVETMPVDACRFFYDCTGCGARLKPKPGDCCVFCSYGSAPCPPIQATRRDHATAASCCG
jgi:hypothetical protein